MRQNNFDFLRLVLAMFVVITHSYFFCGIAENDLLSQLTQGQTTFSYIGVRGFFIISGYLIFLSMQRSSTWQNYYWKRFLRLFPGLAVMLLITVCLGIFVYDDSLKSYLLNKTMWSYLPNNVSLYNLQFGISGVLNGDAINGSLWTIRYEFTMYVLISLLFFVRNRIMLVKQLLIISFLALLMIKFVLFKIPGARAHEIDNSNSLNLALFFISGSILAAVEIEKFKHKSFLLISSGVILALSFYLKLFSVSHYIFFPILIIMMGVSFTSYIHSLSDKFGDFSYGIYIYSYPVQKVLVHFFNLNYMQLMGFTLILSIGFGYLSWNLVEKRALGFKYINPFVTKRSMVEGGQINNINTTA
jgi:peptidoglycan/LPS O-acetylase OafA/YrhL